MLQGGFVVSWQTSDSSRPYPVLSCSLFESTPFVVRNHFNIIIVLPVVKFGHGMMLLC